MTNRYHYRPGAADQPPQVLASDGDGYCVQTGQRIAFFAPERPFWIEVWMQYRHLGRMTLRRIRTRYCHRCRANHRSTYAEVLCRTCQEALAQ